MIKKRALFISSILFVIIVATLFVSYGFLGSEISGNETSKNTVFNGRIIKVEYSDGTNKLTSSQDAFVPGSTLTKTFTIKNTGNVIINYGIKLNNITNEFTRPKDLVYELYLGDTLLISDKFPEEDRIIAYNQSINLKESLTYTLKIIYKNSEENQIEDQGKVINASIDFIEQDSTLSNIKILGNSVQNGTPSVNTPVEIQSVGDMSNNLFPYIENEASYNGVHFLAKDGELTISGVTTSASDSDVISAITFKRLTNYRHYATITAANSFILEPGTYTLSADVYNSKWEDGVSLIIGDLGKNPNSAENPAILVDQNESFTITETKYCMPVYHKYKSDITVRIANIQLEKNSIITDFIPKDKYLIPVNINSKNIANLNQVYKFVKNIQLTDNNNNTGIDEKNGRKILKIYSASAYGKENYSEVKKIFKDIFEENTQYTISFDYTNSNGSTTPNLAIKYTDGSSIQMKNSTNHFKYTTTKNKTVESINLSYNAGTTNIYLDTLQIEKGTEETDYEPYRGFHLYLDEPLRKIGDCTDLSCADYIDLKEQKIVRNINSEYITKVSNISIDGGDYQKFLSNIEYKPLLNGSGVTAKGFAISNKFSMSNVGYNALPKYPNLIQSYITTDGINAIAYTFNNTSINTVELAQDQIGEGFEVNYLMESPKYEDIKTTNFYSINPKSNISVATTIPATIKTEKSN